MQAAGSQADSGRYRREPAPEALTRIVLRPEGGQ
jgi:hypothetical protein